jgi:hypothetical protein
MCLQNNSNDISKYTFFYAFGGSIIAIKQKTKKRSSSCNLEPLITDLFCDMDPN